MRGAFRCVATGLLALACSAQAKVGATTSVVSACLTPGGEQLEVAYKVVKSDYRCPLIGHGCTDKPISALLHGKVLPLDGRTTLSLAGEGGYVLREELSDGSFAYNSWCGGTLLRPLKADILAACHSEEPGEACVPTPRTVPRQLEELFNPHSVSADGTLLFAGSVLYSLPAMEPKVELAARAGYQAFIKQLRTSFDTGMTWHDISLVPLGPGQILGMPDFTAPERDVLAYIYDIQGDSISPLPLDLGRLRQRFPGGRMGLEIHDFVYRPGGVTLFLEVQLYGLDQRAPAYYVVLDSASGAFAEIPLQRFSSLDFHLLDVEHSRLVLVDRDARSGVRVEFHAYDL